MSESVVIEVDNGVGIVTLNRPQQHNAFDDVLVGELTVALQGMEADPGVRAIVISSSGESFCAPPRGVRPATGVAQGGGGKGAPPPPPVIARRRSRRGNPEVYR